MTEAPCNHYWLEVGPADPSEDWTEPGQAAHCSPWTPARRTSGGRWETACWRWRRASPRSRSRCWASPGWRFCGSGQAWSGAGGGREVWRAGTECSWEHRGGGGAWSLARVYQADHWQDSLWTSSSHHNITSFTSLHCIQITICNSHTTNFIHSQLSCSQSQYCRAHEEAFISPK